MPLSDGHDSNLSAAADLAEDSVTDYPFAGCVIQSSSEACLTSVGRDRGGIGVGLDAMMFRKRFLVAAARNCVLRVISCVRGVPFPGRVGGNRGARTSGCLADCARCS